MKTQLWIQDYTLLIKVISGCLKYVEYDLGCFIVFIIKNVFTKSSRYFFFEDNAFNIKVWFEWAVEALCTTMTNFTCETQITC